MTRITINDIKNTLKIIKIYRKAYRNWPIVLLNLIITGKAKAVMRSGRYAIEGSRDIIGKLARLYWLTGVSISPQAFDKLMKIFQVGNDSEISVLMKTNLESLSFIKLLDIADDLSYVLIEVEGRKERLYRWHELLLDQIEGIHAFYYVLDVKGRSVLDVGAYIGDSAIYFNLRGARRVVAVEPSPWAFQVAKRNIEANSVDNVVLINCAVDKEDNKKLKLPSGETDQSFNPKIINSKGDVEVPTCTLDSIIEKFGPFDVLKMDCEGCEYDSIPYSKRVGEFREVVIEYHNGYDALVEKLENEGFKVMFSGSSAGKRSKYCYHSINKRFGLIYAVKQ